MAASASPLFTSFFLFLLNIMPFARTQILDPGFAESHSCNTTCQQRVNLGASWEATQHVSANDPFYSPSGELPAQPGQIVHVEEVTDLTNYSVPSGLTMSRFTYTTSDINGTVLPASAYILWPYTSTQESNTFNLVAWAHGTTGTFSSCAPSNYQNLQYNFQVPFALALDGYAVVAPDYAGLGVSHDTHGNPISHPWALGPAQANDLAYAISASRLAFPDNLPSSSPFVVMGHSQGGGTAWAFAQRQSHTPVPGYLGTIALAPVTRLLDQFNSVLSADPTTLDPSFELSQSTIQLLALHSINSTYPGYDFAGATTLGRQRWEVLQQVGGCLPTLSLLPSDVPAPVLPKLLQRNWTSSAPEVAAWSALAENGGKKFKGPLLVLRAEGDSTIVGETFEDAVDRTCDNGEVLGEESFEYVAFQGLEHFPLIQAARGVWGRWIEERFTEQQQQQQQQADENQNQDQKQEGGKRGCTKRRIQGFRSQDMKVSTGPNWLISVPEAMEGWKTAL